ncbi:nucleotide-diphospho-sugar transferase [Microdochium trichocladiopsis]|uniref:Nucleotide-diphospho-sugar transferase n=1 Tax=Microdochium trichocladiopsis TaxID=1682393 RepID=A0A9P8XVG7_9PEZI|nr:nucleotide-diphospho-sugar transferase [Microdochium trichocladiopsis]KAH7021256.1 nucleotide-diphospho-sugar transferase [Microdochium trichocladiopsis]
MTIPTHNLAGEPYSKTKIWTTLLTNRGYFGGLLVLNYSLRKTNSRYLLKVMVTRDVEADTEYMEAFEAAGIPTIVVDKIEPAPRDGKINKGTWEKLAPWGFTEYERVVLLDSDQVILHSIDDMMDVEIPEGWVASTHACTCNPRKLAHYSKDWVPENCAFTAANQETGEPAAIVEGKVPENHHLLNSGTVILQPSKAQYDALMHAMNTDPAVPTMLFFDQDLLAIVYRNKWKPLPYIYNALKPMRSCHSSLWKDDQVRILHYILDKPWKSRQFDTQDVIQSQHSIWWDVWAEVEKEWTQSKDARKRELYESVVKPVVAQE